MSDNPYAAYPAHRDDDGFDQPSATSRVSVMAVLGFICAVVCCIPGLSVIAMFLGLAAYLGISGSHGRVTGKGLAGAAMILGLIVTVIWGALFVGFGGALSMYQRNMMGNAASFITYANDNDIPNARALLAPSADGNLTDAEIAAFATALRAQIGDYQGPPQGLMSLVAEFAAAMGGRADRIQPTTQVPFVPVPLTGDRGAAVALVCFDQTAFGASQSFEITDIVVLLDDGRVMTLRATGPGLNLAQDMGATPIHAPALLLEHATPAAPTPPALPPGANADNDGA